MLGYRLIQFPLPSLRSKKNKPNVSHPYTLQLASYCSFGHRLWVQAKAMEKRLFDLAGDYVSGFGPSSG